MRSEKEEESEIEKRKEMKRHLFPMGSPLVTPYLSFKTTPRGAMANFL